MTLEDWILEDIAKAQHGFYTTKPPWGIMVLFQNNNPDLLEARSRIFGGKVALAGGGPGSWYGDIRTPESIARGKWRWTLHDEEAYLFSKKIRPHLAKHDEYRHGFCQDLITECLFNENRRYKQSQP